MSVYNNQVLTEQYSLLRPFSYMFKKRLHSAGINRQFTYLQLLRYSVGVQFICRLKKVVRWLAS